jgi:hypothetical protein
MNAGDHKSCPGAALVKKINEAMTRRAVAKAA